MQYGQGRGWQWLIDESQGKQRAKRHTCAPYRGAHRRQYQFMLHGALCTVVQSWILATRTRNVASASANGVETSLDLS